MVGALLIAVVVTALVAALQFRATAEAEAKAKAVEAKARVDLEGQLYISNIAVAEGELTLNQDIGLASKLLNKCPEHLRGWEWHYLMRLRDGPRAPLTGHKGGLWKAAFSPDGRHLATASIDGTIKIWETATGREVRSLPGVVPVMCLTYSPDGKYIASGSLSYDLFAPRKSKGLVKVWEADTGRLVAKISKYIGFVYSVAYSPDGRHLAYALTNDDRMFVVCDAHTQEEIRVFRGNTSHIHRLALQPGRPTAPRGLHRWLGPILGCRYLRAAPQHQRPSRASLRPGLQPRWRSSRLRWFRRHRRSVGDRHRGADPDPARPHRQRDRGSLQPRR